MKLKFFIFIACMYASSAIAASSFAVLKNQFKQGVEPAVKQLKLESSWNCDGKYINDKSIEPLKLNLSFDMADHNNGDFPVKAYGSFSAKTQTPLNEVRSFKSPLRYKNGNLESKLQRAKYFGSTSKMDFAYILKFRHQEANHTLITKVFLISKKTNEQSDKDWIKSLTLPGKSQLHAILTCTVKN